MRWASTGYRDVTSRRRRAFFKLDVSSLVSSGWGSVDAKEGMSCPLLSYSTMAASAAELMRVKSARMWDFPDIGDEWENLDALPGSSYT
jgi:hypothetical protein